MAGKTIVVGAGIVGLNTARLLARNNYNVVLVEAREPGYGASGHNAGVLHVIQPPPWSLKARLARRANRLYDEIAEEAGFPLRRMPALLLYRSSSERAKALLIGAALKALRYPVRLASQNEVRSLCPLATRRALGAVLVEGYGSLIPWDAVERLYEHLVGGAGVEPVKCRVERIRIASRGVEAECGDRILEGGYIVNAAGAGAAPLAETLGLRVPRQHYYKGVMSLARSSLECNAILAGVSQETRSRETKGGGVIPWPDGRILLGPSFEATRDPWDSSVSRGDALRIASAYRGLLGEEPEITGAFAGTRVKNRGGDYRILVYGRSIHFLGIDSPGFTAAPLLGERALEAARRVLG